MVKIAIQSGTRGIEFFPVLRFGHGPALPGRDGYDRALGDARADAQEAEAEDAAADEALWDKVTASFGDPDAAGDPVAESGPVIPDGFSIVIDLSTGALFVFREEDELQSVPSFDEGVLVASCHKVPSGP